MPALPVTERRFSSAADLVMTASAPEEVVMSWRLFWRDGDSRLTIQASVTSGSFAVRENSNATNLVTLTPSTTGPVTADISLTPGVNTVKIVSLEAAQLDLVEVYIS